MDNKKYSQPKIIINKVYTKKGDKGKTSIVGGHQVNKSSKIIKAFGDIDELNVIVGICKANIEFINDKDGRLLSVYLQRIQHELFNLGNMIATLPEDFKKSMPSINKNDIENGEGICIRFLVSPNALNSQTVSMFLTVLLFNDYCLGNHPGPRQFLAL